MGIGQSKGSLRRWVLHLLPFIMCHLLCFSVFAADVRNELPSPSNLQAVTLKNSIILSWQWQPPETLPVFTNFGYELKRQDAKTFHESSTTHTDSDLFPGTYTYVVRAYGLVKEKGKSITYVSDWTEPVKGTIRLICRQPPKIDLHVEPTLKRYSSIPSVRFHLKGDVAQDNGCTLGEVMYHLDTGTGVARTGPISMTGNHFDVFVNALGPDDEIPAGRASFTITATAQNEAGPTTSSAYTVDVDLANPYAPHDP